jgi:hypothetical protein
MALFGSTWGDNDDEDIGIFSHWNEDWDESPSNIQYIEKPKKKLSNQEIINIINNRSKKDKEFIMKNL